MSFIALGYLEIHCRRGETCFKKNWNALFWWHFVVYPIRKNHCPLLYWISFFSSKTAYMCGVCTSTTLYSVYAKKYYEKKIYLCDIVVVDIKSNVKLILFIQNARTNTLCVCACDVWKSNKKKRFLNEISNKKREAIRFCWRKLTKVLWLMIAPLHAVLAFSKQIKIKRMGLWVEREEEGKKVGHTHIFERKKN